MSMFGRFTTRMADTRAPIDPFGVLENRQTQTLSPEQQTENMFNSLFSRAQGYLREFDQARLDGMAPDSLGLVSDAQRRMLEGINMRRDPRTQIGSLQRLNEQFRRSQGVLNEYRQSQQKERLRRLRGLTFTANGNQVHERSSSIPPHMQG